MTPTATNKSSTALKMRLYATAPCLPTPTNVKMPIMAASLVPNPPGVIHSKKESIRLKTYRIHSWLGEKTRWEE